MIGHKNDIYVKKIPPLKQSLTNCFLVHLLPA